MRVRALDTNGDWTFGKGQNDYLTQNNAIAQLIQTRLMSFLGDCFFDLGSGLDWFTYLGGKDQLAMRLAIAAVILNTNGVTGIAELSVVLSSQRLLTVIYKVTTAYPNGNVTGQLNRVLSESGLVEA